jgi:TPR repeat protein
MRISSARALLITASLALLGATPGFAQAMLAAAPVAAAPTPDAVDAAQALASALDGAGGGVTAGDQITALQDAATAGDPMAQFQLGLMYENGEGVEQDRAKAFGYFAEIANQHADAAPKGTEADIVAHSFVKMGEYYQDGVPEAGIPKDERYSIKLLLHAATYFGDAEAQYRIGMLYLDKDGLGDNPVQSSRWLYAAATKGNVAAQAHLGDLLFNGDGAVKSNPVEGLTWLTVASRNSIATTDAGWIADLLNAAMSVASPDARKQATDQADSLEASLRNP